MVPSAIYGTDAVSGVVNIILEVRLRGLLRRAVRYGWSTGRPQGHYAERSGYVVGGVSDGKEQPHSFPLSGTSRTRSYNYERPYSAVTFGTGTFPGSISIGSSYYYPEPEPQCAGGHRPVVCRRRRR